MIIELSDIGLAWPIVTFDFEANGLDIGSYPIEIGLCRWDGIDQPIRGWSSLIKPTAQWVERSPWSHEAEQIHHIAMADLQTGMGCAQVVQAMNAFVGDLPGFCDGSLYDMGWLGMLGRASGVRPQMRFGDYAMLRQRLDDDGTDRLTQWLDANQPGHRAFDDAARLMQGFATGLGVTDIPVVKVAKFDTVKNDLQ